MREQNIKEHYCTVKLKCFEYSELKLNLTHFFKLVEIKNVCDKWGGAKSRESHGILSFPHFSAMANSL